ncbi:MAG: hypothetical protein HDT39_01040 [Lachnospiraceae bacterium]|nr:hypothetical protein [Lachnospiraceae bacterium]
MNIGYIFDENYIICGAVSIFSLMYNNKEVDEINIYIFDGGISDKSKNQLFQMVHEYRRTVKFIDINNIIQMLKEMDVEPWNGSYTAYVKLMLSNFLPKDINRFIVIDADTVIDGSIEELDKMSLKGHPCAMGLEGIYSRYKKYAGIGNNEHFNTGVIVYDLSVWREKRVEEKLIYHLKNIFGRYMLPEEDPISIILRNDVERLNPKYNYLAQFEIFGTEKYFKRFGWKDAGDKFYSLQDLRNVCDDVVIYHFIDTFTNRPWDENNCHPFSKKYDFYFNKISSVTLKKKKKKMSFSKTIEYYLRLKLPQKLSVYLYYFAAKSVYGIKAKIYYKNMFHGRKV